MVEEEEEESIQPLLKIKQTTEFRADVYGLEILSYLPAKSVQALELVCKDWLQLIRSSDFVRFHHSRGKQSRFRVLMTLYPSFHTRGILEYNNYYQECKRQITYPPQFSVCANILGSADGLIFMLQKNLECVTTLFNPSTGKYFHVQLSPSFPRELHYSLCSWFGKLGDGEYCLVMVMRFGGPRHEIWVYKFTLNSIIINRISFTEFINFDPIEKIGTLVQGVVHWPVQFGLRSAILAYHIGDDRYFEISPPVQCTELGLFVDGCNLFATTNSMGFVAELWIMKQDNCWSKYANIEGSDNFKNLSPLGFSPDGGDLIMDVDKSRLMKYSFTHNEPTLLMDHSPRRQVIMCDDTLVSPGCC